MIDTSAPATEKLRYPTVFIGGPAHGQFYLRSDNPYLIEVPVLRRSPTYLRFDPLRTGTCEVESARYLRSTARVSGYATDWVYYRHESMDDQEGMFTLWAFLWEAAGKIARAGGWEESERCPYCKGSGMEPRR